MQINFYYGNIADLIKNAKLSAFLALNHDFTATPVPVFTRSMTRA